MLRIYDARWTGRDGIGRHAGEVADRVGDNWQIWRRGPDAAQPRRSVDPAWLSARLRGLPRGSLFASPGYYLPVAGMSHCKLVPTLHDLIHLHTRHRGGVFKRAFYRGHVIPALRRCPAVLAVSAATAEEIAALGIDEANVHIIGNGLSAVFKRDPPVGDRRREPVVLAFASPKTHKNLTTLLAAMATPELGSVRLRLIGLPSPDLDRRLAPLTRSGRVEVLRDLDESQMHAAYASAGVFATVSTYEGFNLPLIEAVACGTPVVASDLPVHREVVAGLGGIAFVEPLDAVGIADSLLRQLDSPPSEQTLAEGRRQVVDRHSWDRVAARVNEVCDQIAGEAGPG